MLAHPRGDNASSAAVDHSLLSFAIQHPLRYPLGEPIATAGLLFEQRDALNEQVRQVVVSNFIEELV